MINELIVRALVELIVSIDLTDADTVDPDFASASFGDVVVILDGLPRDEREKIVGIVRGLAEDERVPERRQALLEFPENFGLLDDDDE